MVGQLGWSRERRKGEVGVEGRACSEQDRRWCVGED